MVTSHPRWNTWLNQRREAELRAFLRNSSKQTQDKLLSCWGFVVFWMNETCIKKAVKMLNITVSEHHILIGEVSGDPHVDAVRTPEVRVQSVSAGWDECKADIQTVSSYNLFKRTTGAFQASCKISSHSFTFICDIHSNWRLQQQLPGISVEKEEKKNHIIFSFLSPVGSGSTWKSLTLSAVTYWPFVWWAQFLHRLLNNNDTQKIQPEGKVAEIMTQRTNTKVLLCALLM